MPRGWCESCKGARKSNGHDAATGSDDFFAQLPAFSDLDGLTDPFHYRVAPADWLVFVTDVRGSTRSVAEGRYKEVNTIGAATIVAAQNACPGLEFPFVFGGDGATLMVPPSSADAVGEALCFIARKSRQQFGLELRVGRVPVAELAARGRPVLVAKRELSPGNRIAMFAGGGLSEATDLVKSPDGRWLLKEAQDASGTVDGLECRWCAVPARHHGMLSLILRAPDGKLDLYRQALKQILAIAPQPMPITPQNLPTRWPPEFLMHESRMKRDGLVSRWLHWLGVASLTSLLTVIVKRTRHDPSSVAARYIASLCRNNDYLKLDDYLRMVIDVTEAQREQIEALLEDLRLRESLQWGSHLSSSALFTCMVRSQEEHLHFVDGNDGGYTAAARDMERRAGNNKNKGQ